MVVQVTESMCQDVTASTDRGVPGHSETQLIGAKSISSIVTLYGSIGKAHAGQYGRLYRGSPMPRDSKSNDPTIPPVAGQATFTRRKVLQRAGWVLAGTFLPSV